MENENEILKGIYDTLLSNIKPAARRFAFTWLRSTAEWAGSKSITGDISFKTFRPALFFKLITILVFGGATGLLVKEMIVNPGDKLGLMIFLLFLFGGFLFFALYQFVLNKKLNYTIIVDTSGIKIAGDSYTWKNIGATGILTKGINRNRSHYLLIATRDGTGFRTYSLWLFLCLSMGGFPHKLSKYIGYFKPAETPKA